MPEAVGVLRGGFSGVTLENCFFPKVVRVGDYTFTQCGIQRLGSDNFPALEAIGEAAFMESLVAIVDLPNLTQVKAEGFRFCQKLKSFSAPKL